MISHLIAEAEVVVRKIEDELGEVAEYPQRTRDAAAMALSDLAVRLELVRIVVLDRGADDLDAGA